MDLLDWILLIVIIFIGVVGGYFQLQMFSHFKEHGTVNVFSGAWIFDEDLLTDDGKKYRSKIIICWLIVAVLAFFIMYS